MQVHVTCEICSEEIVYLRSEFASLPETRQRRYRCDTCPPAPRERKAGPKYPRDHGCIVTATTPDGTTQAFHKSGPTGQALLDIVNQLPEGSTVESICTPATIRRDLAFTTRHYGGRGRATPDAWSAERALLGKIGRLDLLPKHAHLRSV